MSRETYVNRVSQGPHFEEAGQELRQDPEDFEVDEIVSAAQQESDPETEEPPSLSKVGPAPVFEDAIPALTEFVKSRASELSLLPSGLQVDEFEVFRLQVIAAFKHLGLDVKKHFGV